MKKTLALSDCRSDCRFIKSIIVGKNSYDHAVNTGKDFYSIKGAYLGRGHGIYYFELGGGRKMQFYSENELDLDIGETYDIQLIME